MAVEEGDEERVSALVRNSLQLSPEIVGSPETSDLAEQKINPSSDSSEVTVSVGSSEPPEREGISPKRLAIIVLGLCTTIFLTAMDQTIVSTVVPTIVNDLGDASGYTWIGTAYLLASTVLLPLYGKASDIWGRKPVLFISIGLFELGSALCGASISMPMLIASRVVQGLGGGGIMGLVNIIMTDITSLRDRAKWTAWIGATWAVAAACGPLIGGAIATGTTWRWCFLINVPIGAVCAVIIFVYLHLDSPRLSFWDKAPRVDYFGTLLIGGSALMFLLALNWAGAGFGWGSPRVVGLLVGAAAALVPFWFVERFWAKEPVMPMRLFTHRTNDAAFFVGLCHRIVYMGLTYYLPLYFQAVKGYSAVMSGVALLPYILTCCLLSASVGRVVTYTGRYNPVIRIGFGLTVLGTGLLTLLDADTPVYAWVLIEIVCGLGLGGNFQNMLIAIQATINKSDIAVATATFSFIVLLGATLGIAIGGTVFQNEMTSLSGDLPDIPGLAQLSGENAGAQVLAIQQLPDGIKQLVVNNYAESMRMIWIVLAAFSGAGFLAAFAIGSHELYRDIRTDQPAMMSKKKANDIGHPTVASVAETAIEKV